MVNLVALSNGNLSSSTTWGAECGGTGATQLSYSTAVSSSTIYSYSPTFTCNSGDSIFGVLINLSTNPTTSTNTFSIALSDDNGVTATREVTVLMSDMHPIVNAWVYFKFGTPLTADGGSDYRLGIKSSTSSYASVRRSATSNDFMRIIVTNNHVTPAAGDVLWIAGGKTANSTGETTVVTMDGTTVTNYGNVSITHGGIFQYGTSASTNYVFQCEGNINVYANGILWVGNTTNPIPRSSTANLQIMCQSDGQYRLFLGDLGKVQMVGESRTSGKDVVRTFVTANVNIGDSVLTVNSDTGWTSGDTLYLAPSSLNQAQTEIFTVSSSNSTTITINETAAYTHTSNSMVKLPIVNVTRNVRFRSANSTSTTYIHEAGNSTLHFIWASLDKTGNSSGYSVNGISTACNYLSYSSFVNIPRSAFIIANNSLDVITGEFSANNLIFANCGSVSGSPAPLYIYGRFTAPTTIRDLTFIKTGQVGSLTGGITGYTSNLIIADCVLSSTNTNSYGFQFYGAAALAGNAYSSNFDLVTISNCHFNFTGTSVYIVSVGPYKISNSSFFSSSSFGVNAQYGELTIENTNMYGSGGGGGGIFVANGAIVSISNCIFSNTAGLNFPFPLYISTTAKVRGINSSLIGSTYGIYVDSSESVEEQDIFFSNCVINGPSEITFATITTPDANLVQMNIRSEHHDQTIGNHKITRFGGTISNDTTIYNTSSPSLRLEPTVSGRALRSTFRRVPVAAGGTVTISVKVRKSQAGDGAAYNGTEPQLIVAKNVGANIMSNTVLDTMTYSNSSWETLTGTTVASTSDTAFEFFVECSGTTGWINIDDWDV